MENNKEFANKKRLGRGLGSLLGGEEAQGLGGYSKQVLRQPVSTPAQSSPEVIEKENIEIKKTNETTLDNTNRYWNIAIDKLVPGVYQPRKNFDKESLQELANSIKENGILQPIAVRKRSAGGYEIIAGERRWRAAQLAGLHEIPAIIKEATDREVLQLALIENIQREDLDILEEAESYQRLAVEFSMSQQEVAEKVGKERSSVANSLRILQLPKEIKDMIVQKTISAGHAKVLLSISDKAVQIKLAKQVVDKGLSVRALEKTIKSGFEIQSSSIKTEAGGLNIDIAAKLAAELADQLQKSLGTKVEISYKSGRGQVNIHFYSDDQLTQVYEKLKA